MIAKLQYMVIKPTILASCQATGVDMASSLYQNSCACAQMLTPKYEQDVMTQY